MKALMLNERTQKFAVFMILLVVACVVLALATARASAADADPLPVRIEVADPLPVHGCDCEPCQCDKCECGIRGALAELLTLAYQPRGSCPNGQCGSSSSFSGAAFSPRYSLTSQPAPGYQSNPYPVVPVYGSRGVTYEEVITPTGVQTIPVQGRSWTGGEVVNGRSAMGSRSPQGHTHTCSKGHTWDHSQDGGSHRCPVCGEFQNRVDTGVRQVSAQFSQQSSGGFTISSDGGCGGSSAQSFGGRSGQPVLRINGGPGVIRSFFGRLKGRCGG